MSTNPDIKRALGAVTCEPTEDSIKLFANDVDITDEVGGGEAGYTVEESVQTIIPEQTATGESVDGYYIATLENTDASALSNGDAVTVTFGGDSYKVNAQGAGGGFLLGEIVDGSPVFTTYPFVIALLGEIALFMKQSADAVTIKADIITKNVTPSDNFKAAVAASGGLPDITAEDNGSFPVAQNGEWGKIGGYSVSESTATVIPEQETTTVKQGDIYVAEVTCDVYPVSAGDKCVVSYNGTDYQLTAQEIAGFPYILLGEMENNEPSFVNYPFFIYITELQGFILALSANPTIKAERIGKTVRVSDDFVDAVKTANQSATREWLIEPKSVIYQESEAHDGFVSILLSAAEQAVLRTAEENGIESTIAIINGHELPYNSDEGGWLAVGDDGNEYALYINGNSSNVYLGFACSDGTNYVWGEYEVGICTTTSDVGVATVYFTSIGDGNWTVYGSMSDITEALQAGKPVQAFAIYVDEHGAGMLCKKASDISLSSDDLSFVFQATTPKQSYFQIIYTILTYSSGSVSEDDREYNLTYYVNNPQN